tara:strand:+ start:20 stop:160 length:141 start_codon:yes stop_codon:yes gene_type:complete
VGSGVASGIVDGVHTSTTSDEVNITVSVEVLDITISEVLELGEVED